MTAALFLLVSTLTQGGCAAPGDIQALSSRLEPLRVCKSNGDATSITLAEAMAYHHAHEEHAAGGHGETDHEEGLCVGVAAGYQAIRYAAAILFPGETPKAPDIELSVVGAMPGIWDAFDLYTGRNLNRPEVGKNGMSLESFTFTARRVSMGKIVVFRLRDRLIPPEFFELNNRGASCDDDLLETVKEQAARRILSVPPTDCFTICSGDGATGR